MIKSEKPIVLKYLKKLFPQLYGKRKNKEQIRKIIRMQNLIPKIRHACDLFTKFKA
jgi:hypothetical protein